MAAVLKHWREAATLIIVTSSKFARGGPRPQLVNSSLNANVRHGSIRDDFDVLMLKRSSKSKFMPDVHVFPGGVADDSDFSGKWLSVFNKLGSDVRKKLFQQVSKGSSDAAPMFARQREPAFSEIPSEVAFRICAIRETFEESGVLLVQPAKKLTGGSTNSIYLQNGTLSPALLLEDVRGINEWRQRVNSDPNEFLNMCLELDLIPEVWSLFEWSDWLTPTREVQNSRRFDTAFFVCCIDHKPDAAEDTKETVNALWASPSSLLSAFYTQKGGLAPPQVYELSRLLNFKSARDLLQFVSQPDRVRVEQWLPVGILCKDHSMGVLPGDDLYPKEPDFVRIDTPVFEETLVELNQKYPNKHRTVAPLNNESGNKYYGSFVEYTVQPRKGHVGPNTEMLNTIILKAKL